MYRITPARKEKKGKERKAKVRLTGLIHYIITLAAVGACAPQICFNFIPVEQHLAIDPGVSRCVCVCVCVCVATVRWY